ncbi:DUF4363 family protein [Desulfofalx alkaliphila]|uniref:DUF4363 family protein n=1 Tax=Desulfofalx alkaliphila TaxID=105483 RepID=UPI0004E100A1|nr:DUF4363 family protein [Desulfofalx alkaliphila]
MRLLIVLSAILVSFMVLGSWVNHSLTDTAEVLSKDLVEIMQEIEQDNWQDALDKTKALEQQLKEKTHWWPMILDHQEIDEVEFALARLKEYVAAQNPDLSLAQLSEIKLMLQHIPDKESVTLKNIF